MLVHPMTIPVTGSFIHERQATAALMHATLNSPDSKPRWSILSESLKLAKASLWCLDARLRILVAVFVVRYVRIYVSMNLPFTM